MALTAHVLPNVHQVLMTKQLSLNNVDALKGGLVASGTNPNTGGSAAWAGYKTVADFLTNGTYPQTEVSTSGTGYTRQALTSVSVSTTGLFTTLVVGTNPSWAASTISAVAAFFYDAAVDTNDTTRLMLAWWDFGGTNTDSNGVYTLIMPTANSVAGALVQITAAL